jgi:ADP-ribose pyrophosphatase
MKTKTLTLYRPTGLKELELIFHSGMKAFPPRLPGQPIFYPVLNQGYAEQIARDWNAKDANAGFVLKFEVEACYAARFERQVVGGQAHEEFWVPAEQLDEFNRHIHGNIQIIEVYKGDNCKIEIDAQTLLPTTWEPRRILFQGKHLSMHALGKWEYAVRNKTSGIVGILAVTPENKILLVEQYRPPLGKRVIEIPAGLAGDIEGSEDEALAIAATRELLEETGYKAGSMRYLTEGPASAGLSTEVITFFHACGLKKVTLGGGDAEEDITVHEVPLSELENWLLNKCASGCLVDYKIYASLYFLTKGVNE